jgi:hypothetical protein
MSLSHGAKFVTSGLQLHLDAANAKVYPGTGTVCNDLITPATTGTMTNVSVANGAFVLATSYIDLPDGAGTYGTLGNNFTLAAWIKTSIPATRMTFYSSSYWAQCVEFGTSSNVVNGLEIYYPGIFVCTTAANVIQADRWHNVVYARSNSGVGNQFFYVDGVQVTLSGDGGNAFIDGAYTKTIGARGVNGARNLPFIGSLATMSVYNRCLTADEIAQNFNALRGRFGV